MQPSGRSTEVDEKNERAKAAEERRKAAAEKRDTTPPASPETGLVQR